MRKTVLLLMVLGAGVVGCASEDVGGVTDGLVAVRTADYDGVVRYYDPVLSARPLTAAEVGDASSSLPVVMTFGRRYAVAWAVVDGVAQINNGNAVVGAWRIFHSENAEAIDGELRPGETPVVTVPDEGGHSSPAPTPTTGNPLIGSPDVRIRNAVSARGTGVEARPDFVFLRWLDEASDEYRNVFEQPNIHGGCL